MEPYVIMLLGFMSGFGLGWIMCHALVVRDLIRQIIQMRAMGFDPARPARDHAEYEDIPTVNET